MRLVTQVVFAVISAKTTKVYSISVYWYRLLFVTSVRWPSPEWSLRLTRRPSVSVCWREIRTWAPHLQSRSVLKHKIMIFCSCSVLFTFTDRNPVYWSLPAFSPPSCPWSQRSTMSLTTWLLHQATLKWWVISSLTAAKTGMNDLHVIVVQNGVCKVTMQGAVMLWHWSASGVMSELQ